MNQITKLDSNKPLNLESGMIYEYGEEIYILAEYSSRFFLVNLRSGSTFNGVRDSKDEAFNSKAFDFSLVKGSIVLTPIL